jgi:ubiquinone/menaquinone biosynthesis C-methylase UbiE
MTFSRPGDSHKHSLQTLNALDQYDDFMESIATVADLGCGTGEDLEWWATRATNDELSQPLNIKCTGVDTTHQIRFSKKYPNIAFQQANFEENLIPPKEKFDILWCHDAFQYCVNPLATLAKWWHCASDGGMLAIVVPQTTNYYQKKEFFTQASGCYYHYTMPNLIHMLAVNGWDCREGFFLKRPNEEWLHAVVYKSTHEPMDPRTTTLFELAEKNLLPESAVASINAHSYIRQQDLVLPWLDKSLSSLANQ